MEIVKCTVKHLNKLDDFYERVMQHLVSTVNYPKWTYKVYPCRSSIEQDLLSGVQYACFDGNNVVGAFVVNDDPDNEYGIVKWDSIGKYLVIHTLATDVNCRNKGIAKYMVNYVIDRARRCGCSSVRLDVVPTNFPARKLYESIGFKYKGDYDLKRGYKDIPLFSMYELVL